MAITYFGSGICSYNRRMRLAILYVTVPATTIKSACRGLGRNAPAPNRSKSNRPAPADIISIAQQAMPKVIGQRLPCRAQLIPCSTVVSSKPLGGEVPPGLHAGGTAEMKAMFEATVKPFLLGLKPSGSVIQSRVYRTTGMSESQLNEIIREIFEKSTNPTVGVLAHKEGVDVRLTAKAATESEAQRLLDGLGKTLTQLLPNYIYGLDQDNLEASVGRMLTTRGLTLALAESCTGGLIAHRITRVPGSSKYFLAGYVSYSNESKTDLFGVDPALLKSKGAVSPEVAVKMAEGARKRSGASLALSTTGIAGPDGGSGEKPVGLVWMGLCDETGSQALECRFPGSRDNVQFRASQAGLELLRRHVLGMALKG